MPTLAAVFSIILSGLRAAVANSSALRSLNPAHAERVRARTAMLVLVWGRIGRMANRFEKLFARWRANTLPNRTLPRPRPARASEPATPRKNPGWPTGRAWLVHVVGYEAAGRASQLQHLLAHPDMAAFLHAAPQAGRILRPLCHMLGIAPPLAPAPLEPQPPPTRRPARKPRAPAVTPPAGSRPPGSQPPLRFSPA